MDWEKKPLIRFNVPGMNQRYLLQRDLRRATLTWVLQAVINKELRIILVHVVPSTASLPSPLILLHRPNHCKIPMHRSDRNEATLPLRINLIYICLFFHYHFRFDMFMIVIWFHKYENNLYLNFNYTLFSRMPFRHFISIISRCLYRLLGSICALLSWRGHLHSVDWKWHSTLFSCSILFCFFYFNDCLFLVGDGDVGTPFSSWTGQSVHVGR